MKWKSSDDFIGTIEEVGTYLFTRTDHDMSYDIKYDIVKIEINFKKELVVSFPRASGDYDTLEMNQLDSECVFFGPIPVPFI